MPEKTSKKAALLIGISKYGEGLPELPGVVQDVEALQQVLAAPNLGGFEVKSLIDPELVRMREAIWQLFENSKKEDLALLFFAGHGITDDNGKLYLTTPITSKVGFKANSIPASFVHDAMDESYCKRQVVILDCCYSGAFARDMPRGDLKPNLTENLGGEGWAILTSSSAVQLSFEREGTGIYTHHLVEGIRTGAADRDGDNRVSIQELHEYAKGQVQIAKPGMKPEIHPYKEGFDIFLTKAPINPEREFRREVEKWIKRSQGEFSIIANNALRRVAKRLGVSPETAEQIKAEMLAPYEERRANLAEYQESLHQIIEQEYPFSEYIRHELQDYQQILGLTEEDAILTEQQILKELNIAAVPYQPTNPEPTPEPEPKPTESEPLQTFRFDIVTVNEKGQEIKREQGQAKQFIEDLGDGITLEMVQIPRGTFMMGSPENEEGRQDNESPQHQVTIQPFFMGKFQITQAQWKVVANLSKIQRDLKLGRAEFKGDNRPVERVSWRDVVEFCARLTQKTGVST
ncbi:MAG: caspase family protein [Microcoleaceae cyanobacterium]